MPTFCELDPGGSRLPVRSSNYSYDPELRKNSVIALPTTSPLPTMKQTQSLINMPAEVQLNIYGFVFGSIKIDAEYTHDLKQMNICSRMAKNSNNIIYTCKAISLLAREARLKSFDSSANINMAFQLFHGFHKAQLCNPDYAAVFTKVRFLSYREVRDRECRFETLLNLFPSVEIIETRMSRLAASNFSLEEQSSYANKVKRGDEDFVCVSASESVEMGNEVRLLNKKGLNHVRIFLRCEAYAETRHCEDGPVALASFFYSDGRAVLLNCYRELRTW